MVDDEDSLFEDLDVPVIRSSEKDIKDQQANAAWNLWSELTERPPSKIPGRFRRLYIDLLNQKYHNDRLMRAVSGAAYLPPQKRDPSDLGRLINALRYNGTEAQAISLLDSGTAEIYKWQWQDEIVPLTSAQEVEEICGIPMNLWAPDQHNYAGILIERLDTESLKRVATQVRLHIGEEQLFPSEVIRHHRIWSGEGEQKLSVKINKNRDTYQSGSKESEIMEDVDASADPAAGRLLLNGCPAEKVAEYHFLAPEGYWDTVMDVLEENIDMPLKVIYEEIAQDFDGWTPEQREKPTW